MSGFLRPEAVAWIARRRGLAAAAALALAALLLLGPTARLGAPVSAVLLALALAAALWLARDQWVRLRLSSSGGAGVVSVAEGRIGYFGPVTGGIVDLDALVAVEIVPRPAGPAWLLRAHGAPALEVPLGAAGAEALPDAFAALPGFSAARAAGAADGPAVHRLVWRRPGPVPRLPSAGVG